VEAAAAAAMALMGDSAVAVVSDFVLINFALSLVVGIAAGVRMVLVEMEQAAVACARRGAHEGGGELINSNKNVFN
jgi:hypothetical protein